MKERRNNKQERLKEWEVYKCDWKGIHYTCREGQEQRREKNTRRGNGRGRTKIKENLLWNKCRSIKKMEGHKKKN